MMKRTARRWLKLVAALAAVLAVCFVALCVAARQLYPRRYAAQVQAAAQEFGLDPLLVYAFIRTESSFDANALSNVGARGLMQITQDTYDWIRSKLEPSAPADYASMFSPDANIRYGCYFLSATLARYAGDLATAAAAYHSGWGTVDALLADGAYSADGRTLSRSPYVNMNWYMEKIARCYARYQALYGEGGLLDR